jgi:predicted nucleotide-binding protein
MENSETAVLIQKFRFAHSKGVHALQDFSKKTTRRPFLARARSALVLLYGSRAPVVRKYTEAIRNLRDINEEQYNALFLEFQHILNYLEFVSGHESANPKSQASPPPAGSSIFIIHGHDEMNTLRLHTLLQDHFGLNSVLMMRKPGMSKALLEKFEDAASVCSMAFALITPDDEIANHERSYFQARPNVIFEAGWFVGRLGIPRVCLLLKNGATVQSDIDGISRIHFRDNVEEKVLEIHRELEAVGILKV